MCGLAGAALGSLAGVGAAGVVVLLAGGRPDLAALVPWPSIALALLLGVALAMLAAAWPARVASGLPIVRAVRSE
jgi:ABC-type antimicrobial peptide transport system permease subunit